MGPRQDVRICTAADGTRIVVASIGTGPPLVRAAHWLSQVEHDMDSPVWRPWLRELSRRHTYIRYDQRGCGLTGPAADGLSLETWVDDLEAVVEQLGLERFPLFGMSQGGAVAIAYAHRHPEKVSHLVFMGAYAMGRMTRATTALEHLEAETMVNLMRVGWGRDNDAFRHLFTHQFIPGGTPEQHRWWDDLARLTATPEGAARILETFHSVDVAHLASELRVPALVLHARRDECVPFDEGRRIAALIPGARFVALDSANHVLLEGEPAWAVFLEAVDDFLAEAPGEADATQAAAGAGALTAAEAAVLELLARGLDNRAIAERLGKSEKTVRNQVSMIFDKLGVRTRAEAIVHALGRRGAD